MIGAPRSGDGEVFSGVRFVLFGFDSVSEAQYRSELVRRGGVDVDRYDSTCTHVIVFGHVYDDPICVAARNDRKALVTELWIEDSVDFAILADASRVLYRPIRDLNGIPGSESLFICLTGYQRRERDDIMKMVDLMGAHFSKPLIATKVTHLICYKFEGEKYELAKRVNIKLVNHQWLEDCLKSWEILPVDNYKKSGWELEIMEAEGRNSNEEAEGNSREGQLTKGSMRVEARNSNEAAGNSREGKLTNGSMTAESSRQNSGLSSSILTLNSPKTSIPTVEALTILQQDAVPSETPSTRVKDNLIHNGSLSTCNESISARFPCMFGNCNIPGKFDTQGMKGGKNADIKEGSLWNSPVKSSNLIGSNKEGKKPSLGTINGGSMNSDAMEVKSTSLIYSRKAPRRSLSTESSPRKVGSFPRSVLANDIPSLTMQLDANDIESVGIQGPTTNTDQHHMKGRCSELPQKRKVPNFSSISPKSQFVNSDVSVLQNSLAISVSDQHKFPLVNGAWEGEFDHQHNDVKNLSDIMVSACSTIKAGKKLSLDTINGSSMISDSTEIKSASLIYSRKTPRRSASTEELSRKIGVFLRTSLANVTLKQNTGDIESAGTQNPTSKTDLHHMEGLCGESPQTRVPNSSSISSKVQFGNSDISALQNSLTNSLSAQLEIPLVNVACQGEPDHHLNDVKSLSDVTIPLANQERGSSTSSSATYSRATNRTCLKGQLLDSFHSDRSTMLLLDQRTFDRLPDLGTQGDSLSPAGCCLTKSYHDCEPVVVTGARMSISNAIDNLGTTSVNGKPEDAISSKCGNPESSLPKTPELSFQPDKGGIPMIELSNIQSGETGQIRNLMGVGSSSCSNKVSERAKLSNPTNSSCKASSKGLTKKVVTKKRLSCATELSAECSSKGSSSVYSSEVVSPNESTLRKELEKGTDQDQKGSVENSGTVGTVAKNVIMEELFKDGQNSTFINEKICVNKDKLAYLSENNVLSESAFKLKEIAEPVLKETAIENNGVVKPTADDVVVRGKLKKSHHHLDNRHTKNASKVAVHLSNDADKENKPAETVDINGKIDRLEGQSMAMKCGGVSGWNSRRIDDKTNSELQNHLHHNAISQPAWFIFSGHRLQRKEFQKVIRHLKGRLCRDSHSWSYQATHFIVPDPIRRTEKLFAAAASGRWILKTDYLTACIEAGKLLDEEPFEWYGNGLTEDGAISLEAPRKWRLLREISSHGAFYGMRIIIYGECIAPSLDTLKRVVKAGDGMILATSPPYTRFLKSGVDFAVIGPSMPYADAWIQDFLRHEIACVLPNYLVEYVCKPGYPLGKHVLYETHAWVEKSVAKLLA